MAVQDIIDEAVNAARNRVEVAEQAAKEAAKGTNFAPASLGNGVTEKFIRDEVDSRREAIIAAVVAEAVAQF